jgi:ribosomal-protein-alanine N-acetyltransferase
MVAQKLVRIRDLKPQDMQVVLSIEYKCFKDPYSPGLLNQLNAMHPGGFLVAEVDDKVVGYVIGVMRWGATGHILSIAVDPPYQRHGVGSALMASIMDRLRAKGAKNVRLEARKSNLAAQRFYLKLGFKRQEEIPYYYEDGESGVAMSYDFEN